MVRWEQSHCSYFRLRRSGLMRRFFGSITAVALLVLISVGANIAQGAALQPDRAVRANVSNVSNVGADGGTPTPTCAPFGSYNILIAYSDSVGPTNLRNQLLNETGVTAVDLFNARSGTPTLALMQ